MGDDQILEVVEQRVGVRVLRIRLELGAKGQLAAEIGEFRDRQERRVGALRQRRDIGDVRGGRDAVRIRKLYAVPMGWSQERSSTRNPSSPIAANSVMPMFTSAALNATCLTSFHCPLAPFTSSR